MPQELNPSRRQLADSALQTLRAHGFTPNGDFLMTLERYAQGTAQLGELSEAMDRVRIGGQPAPAGRAVKP